MRIYNVKKASIPKVAVLATGLVAAVLVGTLGPLAAQATPRAKNCAGCHAVGGSTTATPSTVTPAGGAAYTVAITLAANPAGGNSGYAIVPVAPATGSTFGGNTSAALSYTAAMTAPAAAGTYTYNVYTNQGLTDPDGQASSTTYSITVAPVVTVPPTTVPPTTVPPTTVPPTTVPPTTVPPTTEPPVQTAPTVVITGIPPALTTMASATFSFVGADTSDPVGSLVYLCSLDGATASPCTSPTTYAGLTSAAHSFAVTVRDPSSNSGSASYAWRVDRVAPTLTMTAPVNAYALTTTLAPAWSARDDGGVASSDVRWLRAPLNGAFTSAVYPSTWQRTTARSATLAGAAPGFTYCFSARARDNAGNVSPWTSPRCSAVALDDRSMYATAGWVRATGGVFYRSTATVTSRRGVALVKTVQARRIYLVASRYPSGGTVGVFWNGRLIKTVSLQARSTTHRSVLGVTTFPGVRSGTLVIRTLTGRKAVQIDGVVLVRG
ncbi:MAG TPA: hypothetical protein VF391_05190 [Dermatophilaceae bacterium]